MSWANTYVGTPYLDLGRSLTGCDCWGLAREVYARELGIALPSYAGDYTSAEEMREVSGLIDQQQALHWQPVATIEPFDLLLFRRGRHATHVGVAVDARIMLHMAASDNAKIESRTSPRWCNRFVGAFRHSKAPLKGAL